MPSKTARNIITNAFSLLAITNPATVDITWGLDRLNNILASLVTEGINIQGIAIDNTVLTAGKRTYTIGTGGEINTVRPESLASIVLSYPNEVQSEPVKCTMSLEEYSVVSGLSDTGLPTSVWYDNNYPLSKIYFDIIPDKAYTCVIYSNKAFADITDLDAVYDIHSKYHEFLETNLALNLAPRFNSIPDGMVIGRAGLTKLQIQNSNIKSVPPVNYTEISRNLLR